jgi:hypothetical protein
LRREIWRSEALIWQKQGAEGAQWVKLGLGCPQGDFDIKISVTLLHAFDLKVP